MIGNWEDSKDPMGDLLKEQEQREAGRRANPYLPLMARIDGKCFSKFTKGLERPFDQRFVSLMIATTSYLVDESEALLGYCQSDEITLYWNNDKAEYWFGGKYQKLTSVLAGAASSFFTGNLPAFLPEKVGQYPTCDARVWNVPDMNYVRMNFLWRWKDAQKNSVSMYARNFFSHKHLHDKSSAKMKQMLEEIGKPWKNLPSFFREGTYVMRKKVLVFPGDLKLDSIPEKYRPEGPIFRSKVQQVSLDEAWDSLRDREEGAVYPLG